MLTAPLNTIYTSMQLSVLAHATIYGDVKESEVKKPSVIRDKLGLLNSPKDVPNEANTKALSKDIKADLVKAEARADLMMASG